mgnify:FL=1
MRIVNLSRGSLLADSCRLATGYLSRTRGLLFRPPLADGEGLLIRPCQAVHTFLMGFPIDVLFLDKHNRVVHLIESMPPNRASRFVWRAHSTLELPAGTIARSQTRVGDLLSARS